METKPPTLWDHLNNITINKDNYLGDEAWNPWLINKFISMNQDYCEIADILQKNIRIGTYISNELQYRVYRDIVPMKKVYLKYIKNQNKKTYQDDELDIISKMYECSHREAKEIIDDMSKEELTGLKQQYK